MTTLKTRPKVLQENCIVRDGMRISILTSRLIRLEFQKDNHFLDDATQCVLNRDFPVNAYKTIETDSETLYETGALTIAIRKGVSSIKNVSIQVKDLNQTRMGTWVYGRDGKNLKGTARTLDEADGAVALDDGLMGKEGYSVLDDSESLILTDEFVKERADRETDLYFFGYGTDYLGTLKDYYYLCGEVPMIPRYMLGNWWSRFYKYTEQSYLELLEHFQKEEIPLSVAVIDMDWHLTEVEEEYGSGWTGYTWNKKFFPNPKRFLQTLHKRGLHTTLNIHPADGVRAFESMYTEFAKAMGIDPKTKEAVKFDFANPDYIKNYFHYVLHPYEEDGVDFWWVDWQQGKETKIKNLDPLWMLNHFHYLDNQRNGKRPVIFSRYAGAGSHRYPIGFSGDSFATWASLQYQPYFTANASNIGYGWWSHDICGHMHGNKSNDMMMRWLQFGVFSPIMRLHSSGNIFFEKEPWNLPVQYEMIMKKFMQLRHRMIPYIYTMNYQAYHDGIPLIQPLYYHDKSEEAFSHGNEYHFGSEMIVSPIVEPLNQTLQASGCEVYLPKGNYYDFFTEHRYKGNKTFKMYRTLSEIPVLVPEGSIIPLSELENQGSNIENPKQLRLKVYTGKDASFTLYEDDGISMDYTKDVGCKTKFSYSEEKKQLCIAASRGDISLIPDKRDIIIEFIGIEFGDDTEILSQNCKAALDQNTIIVMAHDVAKSAAVTLKNVKCKENNIEKEAFAVLERAEIAYDIKNELYEMIQKDKQLPSDEKFDKMNLKKEMRDVLSEIWQ